MNSNTNAVRVVPQPVPETDELEKFTIPQLLKIKERFVDLTTELKIRHTADKAHCDETDQRLRIHFPYEIGLVQDLMLRLGDLDAELAELEGGFGAKAEAENDGDHDKEEAQLDDAVQREVKKQIKIYWRYISQLTHPDKLNFLDVVLKLGDAERARRIEIYHEAKKARANQDLGTLMWLHASIEGQKDGEEEVSKLVVIREVRASEKSYQAQERLVSEQEETFIYHAYSALTSGTKASAIGIYSQMLEMHIDKLEGEIAKVLHLISQHAYMPTAVKDPTTESEDYDGLDATIPKYNIQGVRNTEVDNNDYSDIEAEDEEFFSHVDDN